MEAPVKPGNLGDTLHVMHFLERGVELTEILIGDPLGSPRVAHWLDEGANLIHVGQVDTHRFHDDRPAVRLDLDQADCRELPERLPDGRC